MGDTAASPSTSVLSFRGVVARKITKDISIQGGIVNSYYKVKLFDKNSFQLLGGVRVSTLKERLIAEVNYRHDLTSENKLKIGEVRVTGYLPYHIFVRTGVVYSGFVSNGQSFSGSGSFVSAGVHF